MKIVLVQPKLIPCVVETEGTLEQLQFFVGGHIESVMPFKDSVCILCNENGKLEKLSLNRALYDENGNLYDIICGNFVIVGTTKHGEFRSLTKKEISRYLEMYRIPEYFI